jgi:hypothetical protein
MTKLYLINVVRDDGNVWIKCVDDVGLSHDYLGPFDGPPEFVGKYFYVSDIKFGGLDYDNTESITIVGNNKEW